jgi:D-3-phosphoglycerate dehydrogenase
LRGLDNVILTPHVGGSTQEAQEEIGNFVATKLSTFMHGGSTALSVNLPEVQAGPVRTGARLAHLHANVPGVLAAVNQVLADTRANVVSQGLATRGELGYVVTDLDAPLPASAVEHLAGLEQTLWLRTFPTNHP